LIKIALNPGQMKMVAHGEIDHHEKTAHPAGGNPEQKQRAKTIKPINEMGWGKTNTQRVLMNNSEFSSPG
jgi:hypothetical protein